MSWKKLALEQKEKTIQNNFFKRGKPTVANSVIAFIDILGFKELIESSEPNKNLQKIYASYIEAIRDL